MMRVYEWAGARVGSDIPDVRVVVNPADRTAFIVSRKIDGLTSHPAAWWRAHPQISVEAQRFWAVDVLLSHWDVVGLVMDNLLVDQKNRPVRIEAGGAGLFRAQGTPKDSFEVQKPWDEPWSMRGHPHGTAPANDQVGGIFDTLDDAQAARLLSGLERLDIAALSRLLAAAGVPGTTADRITRVMESRIQQIPAVCAQLERNSVASVATPSIPVNVPPPGSENLPRHQGRKRWVVARKVAPYLSSRSNVPVPSSLPQETAAPLDRAASLPAGADPFCARTTPRPLLETERFILIPDAYPICRGHLLVIPKKHLGTFSEAENSVLAERAVLTRLGQRFLSDSFGGSVIAWENGGFDQSVPHAHRHLWASTLESLPPVPDSTHEVIRMSTDSEIRVAAKRWGCYFDVELNGEHRAYYPRGAAAQALKTGYVRPSRSPASDSSVAEVHLLWRSWSASHQPTVEQVQKECSALAAPGKTLPGTAGTGLG